MLELLASTLEGVHRRRTAEDSSQEPDLEDLPDHAPQRGDFLMDFARLNIEYLNQLARLGSNYSVVAARALERFYDYFEPTAGEDEPEILHLKGRAETRRVARVLVENPTDERARFRVSVTRFKLPDADEHKPGEHEDSERMRDGLFEELDPHFQHPKRTRASVFEFHLDPNESEEIRLGLRISKRMVLGAEYWGKLVVRRKTFRRAEELTTEEYEALPPRLREQLPSEEYDEVIEKHPIFLRRVH